MLLNTSARRVIAYVHLAHRAGEWFASGKIAKGSQTSRTSTLRVLARLVDLKLMEKRETGAEKKTYRVSKRWPTEGVMDVIEMYELAESLKI